jgi:hypothetical protein
MGPHNTALSCEARLNEDGARSAPTDKIPRFVSFSASFCGPIPLHSLEQQVCHIATRWPRQGQFVRPPRLKPNRTPLMRHDLVKARRHYAVDESAQLWISSLDYIT